MDVTILSTNIICKQQGRYIGWPTIAKTTTGELIVVFSGDRDAHVCPWGKTQMIRSSDNGHSWSQPATINNTPLDDRDAGIIMTHAGTWLVSWFTSLAFENPEQVDWQNLPEDTLHTWLRHSEKLGPEVRKHWLGNWVRRSTDGGKSWEEPIRTSVTAPHGPIQLANGHLIYVGRNYRVGDKTSPRPDRTHLLAACLSTDDGKTWNTAGYIQAPDNVQPGNQEFHEPHVVETEKGVLIALFRHHGHPGQYFLWQSESEDAGYTWSTLHQTPIWGYPPHLIRLSNRWLLVTYGRRKPPYSESACISKDGGLTWETDSEITLALALNSDLGYPASLQLTDGSIYTVYYQVAATGEKTCLWGTHWNLTM
jgi:sialidase-1